MPFGCCGRSNKVLPSDVGAEWAHRQYTGGNHKFASAALPDGASNFDQLWPHGNNKVVKHLYVLDKRQLGEGGFSVVRLGVCGAGRNDVITPPDSIVNSTLNVAVKITKKSHAAMAKREAELLVMVGPHPNVIKLLDCYTHKSRMHSVFEYCGRGDLMDLVFEFDRLEEAVVQLVARDLLAAVAHIHSFDVAHRDIKGENVLCTGHFAAGTLRCRLADFGAATHYQKAQLFSERIGSTCYIAPEVVKQKYFPKTADIWSVGATIYTLLAGTPPFHAPFQDLTLHRVLSTTLRLPVAITRHTGLAGQHFILSLMRRRSWQRPSAATALQHAWIAAPHGGTAASENGTGVAAVPCMVLPEEEDPTLLSDDDMLFDPEAAATATATGCESTA